MLVNGRLYSTIWYRPEAGAVTIIDQTLLPHELKLIELKTLRDFCGAIRHMQVRGAPLIGVTAAYGLALALLVDGSDQNADEAQQQLLATRPTAVNLNWALQRIWRRVAHLPEAERGTVALSEAHRMRQEDISTCEEIGNQGLAVFNRILSSKPGQQTLNILTHCNAGWLATVDWGTALAPIYKAWQGGMKLHVWVDETRPRNQGASLTAWELQQQGIPHTVIADNTGGHLMQRGMVDLCIVGSDRTSANGDVCNKIGTYLKALAAADNNIPFYVALPASTIDWTLDDGVKDIPIEQRGSREVTHISGRDSDGIIREIQLVDGSPAANYAFDITPARLVTALITEHGIFKPDQLHELKIKLGLDGS